MKGSGFVPMVSDGPPLGGSTQRARCRVALAALLFGVAVVSPGAARAHYFWIEPGTFFPRAGTSLPVELWVGHRADRHQLPRDPAHVKRFELLGPDGAAAEPISGIDGRTPAGFARVRAAGLTTLVYESEHSFVELEPEKFEAYLRDEGLLEVIAERRSRQQAGEPGRESFARFCKSLVRVEPGTTPPSPPTPQPTPGATAKSPAKPSKGPKPSPSPLPVPSPTPPPWARDAGLQIEIFPEVDLYAAGVGDELVFRVDLYDRPLSGRQVSLIHLDEADLDLSEVTDGSGRVRFRVPKPGRWMLATVHMRRAPEGIEGDWQSLWASLTFDLK